MPKRPPRTRSGADIVLWSLRINQEPDGLKTIDLGAGHSSGSETLCGRVITALKSQALLNESVGAGYIERNWPPALKESGAWPLASLRQSFLNGSLTRLLDPDTILRGKIVEFVSRGDFGLASVRSRMAVMSAFCSTSLLIRRMSPLSPAFSCS